MADLDNAEATILLAVAKTYAALKIARPSGEYDTNAWVTLNIDGSDYQCRCDCTGVLQAMMRYMGYNGDAWSLANATSSFVKDSDGNISDDWIVLDLDHDDARPGDIRAHSGHGHADMFIAYKDGTAVGMNAGWTTGIQRSCDGGTKYLESNNIEDLMATSTISDADTAKVLRYVKGSGSEPNNQQNSTVPNSSQSLDALDIQLGFYERISFVYSIRNKSGEFENVIPGFFPNKDYYPAVLGTPADGSYGDSWIEFLAGYIVRSIQGGTDDWNSSVKAGLVMMFTLDGSDPLLFGRTLALNDDGSNDYEASKDSCVIIRTQFPVHFRCVITDVATHSQDFGRSSVVFTNQSAEDSNCKIANLVKASKNLSFLTDASGNSPDAEDAHGYLFLHDEDTSYSKEEYSSWVQGREEYLNGK